MDYRSKFHVARDSIVPQFLKATGFFWTGPSGSKSLLQLRYLEPVLICELQLIYRDCSNSEPQQWQTRASSAAAFQSLGVISPEEDLISAPPSSWGAAAPLLINSAEIDNAAALFGGSGAARTKSFFNIFLKQRSKIIQVTPFVINKLINLSLMSSS